ncbi:MAG: LysM peptidoglycan-binding domain-containing protein, partial [Caulobacteraceae bacterium]
MTDNSAKARVLLIATAALAGCAATPVYPTHAGYAPPPPIRPRYPVLAQASAPTGGAPVASPAPGFEQATQSPPGAVEPGPTIQSSPLPAVAAAPPFAAPPAGAASAYAPPPEASSPFRRAPTIRTRTEPGKVTADGRVVAATGMFRDYVVQKHDTLEAIAGDLDTTVDALAKANRLRKPYRIEPGQHLKAPIAKAYVAKGGDTLSDVAKRFGVSVGALADLNDLPSRDRLRSGDKIALPASFHDRGPVREAPRIVREPVL